MEKKSFAPKIESIHEIQEFVKSCLPVNNDDPRKLLNIDLIIEEIVINIINYGLRDHPKGVIVIGVDILNQDMIVEISDNGIEFNPFEIEDPDVNAPLDDREPGGLGFFFVKELTRKVSYSRKDGKNILHLIL